MQSIAKLNIIIVSHSTHTHHLHRTFNTNLSSNKQTSSFFLRKNFLKNYSPLLFVIGVLLLWEWTRVSSSLTTFSCQTAISVGKSYTSNFLEVFFPHTLKKTLFSSETDDKRMENVYYGTVASLCVFFRHGLMKASHTTLMIVTMTMIIFIYVSSITITSYSTVPSQNLYVWRGKKECFFTDK